MTHETQEKRDVIVQLRRVPFDLHHALKKAALDANKPLEQFIIDGLPKLLKGTK